MNFKDIDNIPAKSLERIVVSMLLLKEGGICIPKWVIDQYMKSPKKWEIVQEYNYNTQEITVYLKEFKQLFKKSKHEHIVKSWTEPEEACEEYKNGILDPRD